MSTRLRNPLAIDSRNHLESLFLLLSRWVKVVLQSEFYTYVVFEVLMLQLRIMKSHYQEITGPNLAYFHSSISIVQFILRIHYFLVIFLSSTVPDVRSCSTILYITLLHRRSQWLRGLRHGSDAARLLRLWVRIPPGACVSVCCQCCVLLGRGLCDELITRPEEYY